MNKKKKAFTLIELIAVISILGVIITLTIPRLIGLMGGNKTAASDKVKDSLITAARNYAVDNSITGPSLIQINDLCNSYIDCPVIDPTSNEDIQGCIKITGGTYGSDYIYDPQCRLSEVRLTVDLNGGSSTQTFEETYLETTRIELITPELFGYNFIGWSVLDGNSIVSGNVLTIGTTDTKIIANYSKAVYTITYNLNGGSAENPTTYTAGTETFTLNAPTKYSNSFVGWTGSNGMVPNKTVTIEKGTTGDLVYNAVWLGVFSFKYTGSFRVDGDATTYAANSTYANEWYNISAESWKVYFLSSGTLVTQYPTTLDAFLVGGGAAGNGNHGGGGGYTLTKKNINLDIGTHPIVIGAGGGTTGGATSAFDFTVNGGNGSSGGSAGGQARYGQYDTGGDGASDGGSTSAGIGQGTTTREFSEVTGKLYAGGGGGAGANAGVGGAGGGGTGGRWFPNIPNTANGGAGVANTGGGGGGAPAESGISGGAPKAGAGGSGIVVVRSQTTLINFEEAIGYYTGKFSITEEDSTRTYENDFIKVNTNDWKIKFLTSGRLVFRDTTALDAFLVGGGAGGQGDDGGGGGGYTTTISNYSAAPNIEYYIIIGDGGGSTGGTTSAFEATANGGQGKNGGSGGGASSGYYYDHGGAGGADGASGFAASEGRGTPGTGQGTTTREFGEAGATLYAGGGGGRGAWGSGGAGGAGGGANGSYAPNGIDTCLVGGSAVANTGGGGGASPCSQGKGASGVVVIRLHK